MSVGMYKEMHEAIMQCADPGLRIYEGGKVVVFTKGGESAQCAFANKTCGRDCPMFEIGYTNNHNQYIVKLSCRDKIIPIPTDKVVIQ